MRENLKTVRRIAVKAGTSILSTESGRISAAYLNRLASQIQRLVAAGRQTVLISSGAIAFGMDAAGIRKRPREMPRLQACAAVGQGKLMHAYEKVFSRSGLHTAQVLLTRDGLENRKRFLSARNTLEELLRMKVLPIVNENDTVSCEEIAFGDNDVLSVHVAHLIHADLLVILSDVDGFFLKDGSRVRQVHSEAEIDGELVRHLKDRKREQTVGGMRAKLEAARVAMRLGIPLLLVDGHDPKILDRILNGEDVGTLFLSSEEKTSARGKWIAYSAARKGALVLDAGAYDALVSKKKSLLPSGVRGIKGEFERGQVVELQKADGGIFGRGLVKYSSTELARILGKKTHEIAAILGYKEHDEVIHRNDLVLWP